MSAAARRIVPVTMAGGSGTRLWPLSRAGYPKQFLVLSGRESLFQQSVRRLAALAGPGFELAAPIVVGNDEHRFLLLEQLREIGVTNPTVLLEPIGRNTAPALSLAALTAAAAGDDPILVVAPADQTVADGEAFTRACRDAIRLAADGGIVTLGIQPDRPETGYGYIQAEAANGASPVRRFVEKPDRATAEAYLAAGGYFWNSGIFVLRASVWREALGRFRPDIAAAIQPAFDERTHDAAFVRPEREAFAAVPAESIDYAVIEHCPGSGIALHMVPLDAGWNDLGAWDAVWQAAAKDERGNAATGDAMLSDSRNTLVHATSRLVGVVGVDDLVVVETPDAVLVTHRSRGQDVKAIVAELGERSRDEHVMHRKVHRPWGWYDSIDEGPRFQVKRIQVNPGASLSLQLHHHRAEHWTVVRGTAEVTCGERVLLLSENESTFIPLGEKHRLRNPGKLPLEIIEVQSGAYLGEDDIVRFDDHYGRP